jgi:iron complex transport system permease protein
LKLAQKGQKTDLNIGAEKNQRHYKSLMLTLFCLWIAMILAALCLGRYGVSVSDAAKILISRVIPIEKTWDATTEGVIMTLRLPRIVASLLIGGALALSGASYQGVFKNPLVSPDLLGVSSGATVGAALIILAHGGKIAIQMGAFLGGLTAVFIAISIPRLLKNNSITILVLSGIIVSGIMSSIMGVIKYLADPDNELASIVYWQMGSLAKALSSDVIVIIPVILVTSLVLLGIRWRINILSLGENEAKSLGMNTTLIRGVVILCSTILTASSVCISGTIGWIGLVIPHLGRLLVGPDNVKLLPATMILGSIFMLFIDTVARVSTTAELPLSILTGIIGAPFYFWLLACQRMKI